MLEGAASGGARSSAGSESGVVVAEFVLVAGLLVALSFCLVDLGLLWSSRLVVIHAARVALRQAMLEGGAAPAVYRVARRELDAGGLSPGEAEVRVWPAVAPYGTPVAVRVAWTFRFHAPLPLLAGRPLRLETVLEGRSESPGPGVFP